MHLVESDPRLRKRIPCSIQLEGLAGQEQKAVVLNLSRGGLFVQTTARASRGDRVAVSFELGSSGKPVSLPARVVWTRRRTARSAPVDGVGFGVQLQRAPQTYLDLCDHLLPKLKEDTEVEVEVPLECDAATEVEVEVPLDCDAVGEAVDAEATPHCTAAAAEAPPAKLIRYRVRLKLGGTARTRWVECEAPTRDLAGDTALGETTPVPGARWEVLEVRSAPRA